MVFQELYNALEQQYKTKYKGPKSFPEYVAQWLGKVISKAALEYGTNVYDNEHYKKQMKASGLKPEYKNSAEFMLENVLDAVVGNSHIEDNLRDVIGELVDKYN